MKVSLSDVPGSICQVAVQVPQVRKSCFWWAPRISAQGGGGGTQSIHDMGRGGGPPYFFGLKIYKLCIFFGQEICHVF